MDIETINGTAAGAGMVIIGAGHCGGRAALTLRTLGWQGAITVLGEETHLPYERPPLSKGVLFGDTELSTMQLADEAVYRAAGIALCLDARVRHIDRDGHSVWLDDGVRIPYSRLLLATGGSARQLAIPGAADPRVLSLRTHADAMRIKEQLRPGGRVVLIGGGFIGLEVAASARATGCEVDVIEGAPRLLGRAVPEAIASRVLQLHISQGTRIHFGVQPLEIVRTEDAADATGAASAPLTLRLADGSSMAADLVVVGVGMVPRTELARECGLSVEQGIVVDTRLRTSDAAIFAAGDVCQFPSALTGALMRQETWHNAETQAGIVAANMLGADTAYADLPWFWSDQYDHTLQVCGEPGLGVSSVTRLVGEQGILMFFLDADGKLVGGSGFGSAGMVAKDLKLLRKLVEQGARVAPAQLQDAGVGLKKLLVAA